MTCEKWRDRLDAYVDGEAPPPEIADIDEHLRTCRDCSSEVIGRMQIKQATRVAAMRFRPSPELRQRIENSIAPRRNPFFAFLKSPALAIAVALVLALSVSSVLLVNRSSGRQELAQLVDLHVAALASPNPVDVVSTDRHTVKPWFQGKLPFTFNLPELEGSQYKLAGGKLVYFEHLPGAQLLYELRKHELSVFIVQDSSGVARRSPSAQSDHGFNMESWSANGLRYTVVSDAGPGDVHALGDLMRSVQQ